VSESGKDRTFCNVMSQELHTKLQQIQSIALRGFTLGNANLVRGILLGILDKILRLGDDSNFLEVC
jgi:hypothetical protein